MQLIQDCIIIIDKRLTNVKIIFLSEIRMKYIFYSKFQLQLIYLNNKIEIIN